MKWDKICSAAAVAAVMAATAPATQAQVTASASLDHFSYTLTDLDPNDGIVPTFTLTASTFSNTTSAYPDDALPPSMTSSINHLGTVSIAPANGSGRAGSDGVLSSAQVALTGTGASLYALSGTYWNFSLSAHTSVTLTVNGSASSSSSGVLNGLANSKLYASYGPFPGDSGPIGPGGPTPPGPTYISDGIYSFGDSQSRALTITFNAADQALTGQLSMEASASGLSPNVIPVPEPETYAMMLAGLLLVGVGARRSRKAACRA